MDISGKCRKRWRSGFVHNFRKTYGLRGYGGSVWFFGGVLGEQQYIVDGKMAFTTADNKGKVASMVST